MNYKYLLYNLRFVADFKRFLEREDKKTNTTSYVYGVWSTEFGCYQNFLDTRKLIFFYEFSNLNNPPKRFHTIGELFRFLKESTIELPAYYMKEEMKKHEILYMCCKQGTKDLLCESTLQKLREKMNPVNNNNIKDI